MEELIRSACDTHRDQCRAFAEKISELIPIGSLIYFERGRGKIEAEVRYLNISCWWHDPGSLQVRNVKTGKFQTVSPFDSSLKVLRQGKEEA